MQKVVLLCAVLALAFAASLVDARKRGPVPGQYIVVFKDDVSEQQTNMFEKAFKMQSPDHEITHQFKLGKFRGFAAKATDAYYKMMKNHPQVKYIERDQYAHTMDLCEVEKEATWGLDRISEEKLPLDGTYNYDTDGTGVDAYIVDTGVYIAHKEFQGRAIWGATFTGDGDRDQNGHGTHVAGTIGGAKYGVAKNVTLIAVKVLGADGSGTYAGVIKGINWVVDSMRKRNNPSVANMSLGGPYSKAVNDAVSAAVEAGVVFGVAAGNEDSDACEGSPSSTAAAITVGATKVDVKNDEQADVRSSFSNWGTCVDIFAPGSLITSAWIGDSTATKTISGTSMATPHVVGAAARYLSQNPNATPKEVKQHLVATAGEGLISLDCQTDRKSVV